MTDQNCVVRKPDLVRGKILRNKGCAGAWEAEADEFWSPLSAQPSPGTSCLGTALVTHPTVPISRTQPWQWHRRDTGLRHSSAARLSLQSPPHTQLELAHKHADSGFYLKQV